MGDSTTKVALAPGELGRVMDRWFPDDLLESSEVVANGFFNMTYRVRLARRGEVYLRVAPPEGAPVMRYERSALRAEVMALRLVRDRTSVPVPDVIVVDDSRESIARSFIVLSAIKGEALDDARSGLDASQLRDLGASIDDVHRQFHGIAGEAFGPVVRPAPKSARWSEVLAELVEDVIADARDASHRLPVDANRIRRIVHASAATLDLVTRPVFVHWDLWDGNLFVDSTKSRISGVIDFERAIWADPLMDFAFRRSAPRWEGTVYLRSLIATVPARLRSAIYDVYFLMLCHVEASYRARPVRDEWLESELHDAIEEAERLFG